MDTNEGRWVFIAVVVGVLILGLWDWRRTVRIHAAAADAALTLEPFAGWQPLPRRRVAIERPGSDASKPVARASARELADPIKPRSEIPEVEGGSPDLAIALKAAMTAVTGEMVGCLAGWHEAQPDVFVGRAVFAFHLDVDGLAELDVLDVDSVPPATLTCLGDVLWDEVEWPKVTAPIEVTWPVQVSVDTDG